MVILLFIETTGGRQRLNCANTEGGNAREDLEQRSGKKVITRQNYLPTTSKRKKIKL